MMISVYLLLFIFLARGNCVPVIKNESVTLVVKDMDLHSDILYNITYPAVPLTWRFEDKGYYLGMIFKANFFEAGQFSSFHGMRLLSIESEEENVFLGKQFYKYGFTEVGDMFWTSGTKLPDDEHWVWLTTGTRLVFTNWAPGEPNNKLEKCLEINRYKINKKKDLFWNDQNCAVKHYFICEYQMPKNVSSTVIIVNKVPDPNTSTTQAEPHPLTSTTKVVQEQ